MLSSLVAFLGVAAVAVVAQQPTTNFSSTDINAIIGNVTLTERNSWCTGQHSSCGTLCSGLPSTNDCSGANLTWNCICQSNNSAPALQYYNPTMVSYICNNAKGRCLANSAGDSASQDQCSVTYVCGNSSVADFKPDTSMATASGSSTSSGGPGPTGSSSASGQQSTSTSHGAAAPTLVPGAETVGFGVLGAGFLAMLQMAI